MTAHAMCCDRHVLLLPEEKIAQGLLSRGIDSQPLREVFLDRPVAFLHFVEGRFQVLGLHPEDSDGNVTVAAGCDEAVDCPLEVGERVLIAARSEERRVGKECRSRWGTGPGRME